MDGIPFFLLVVNLGLVDIFRFTDVTAAVHTLNCSSGDDFKDKDLFGDAIAVNLAIMLVMTTIFTSNGIPKQVFVKEDGGEGGEEQEDGGTKIT